MKHILTLSVEEYEEANVTNCMEKPQANERNRICSIR